MKKLIVFDGKNNIAGIVAQLTSALRSPGGVVLVPTETVYGLVARAADEAACKRIFELKNRPAEKRIGWFISDWRKLKRFGVVVEGLPASLAERFMPGALTVIAPTCDGGTQGFRIPDHSLLSALLKEFDEPLVQTSANASGNPDPLSVADALSQLHGEVDVAVDGGKLQPGATGSTVVDATGEKVKVLRYGALGIEKFSELM